MAVWSASERRAIEGIDNAVATAWRNTYKEHAIHVRHRARVPSADVLIKGTGILR